MPIVTGVALIALLAAAGTPSGSGQRCVACHAAQARSQPQTPMSHALEPAASCEILRANPKLTWSAGRYSYQIAREGTRSLYMVTDGKHQFSVPIVWALGLGAAGQTYLYEWKGNWYESHVSFYRKLGGLDVTMGSGDRAPSSVEEAAGRLLAAKEAVQCFNCHATNASKAGRLDVDHLAAGVQCERCHGPSEQHVAAFKSGNLQQAAMPKLGTLRTEEVSDFCGQCHRSWAQIATQGPHDINNVRFQPYRLTNSRCYDAGDGRISCVACHDPHQEAVHVPAFYDAKCLACHGGDTPGTGSERTAKICPTGNKDCVVCHMPKYELPGSHNLFADHWIRVVKPGAPYPD